MNNNSTAKALNQEALQLEEGNRFAEAIGLFEKAIKLAPNVPQLYNNLGSALGEVGRYKEEMKAYQRAISLNPNYGQAWGNLGASFRIRGDTSKAIECYEKAIALTPEIPEFRLNMGLILQEKGGLDKALKYFEEAVAISPNLPKAQNSIYLIKRQICDWNDLSQIEQKMDKLGGEDPYTSILRSGDFKKNFEVAREWSRAEGAKAGDTKFVFEKKRKKKIRLGYISADFRNHPIGQMVATMFSHHDRNKFEVFGYSYGENDRSIYRRYAEEREGMDKFIEIQELENREAAQKIFDDKIDILIDITGYTADNRMEILAMHPARIQISWLGFPGTSGADFFDYIIADTIIVPPSVKKFFSEKVIYMPHSYQINNNKIEISPEAYSREEFGLPPRSPRGEGVVFASFNQAYKIEPVMWEVWMNILIRVPKSVLWLWEQDKEATENLKKEAEARGVNPLRLIFAKRLPKEEHLARIKLADLGLDTRIYGGHTTTSDFLWAGVPVVTKLGNHFASRVCASILTEAGIPELITKNLKEYEDLAVELAGNHDKLEKYRGRLTHKNLESTLYNTKRFVQNLEAAYLKIWKEYGENKKKKFN